MLMGSEVKMQDSTTKLYITHTCVHEKLRHKREEYIKRNNVDCQNVKKVLLACWRLHSVLQKYMIHSLAVTAFIWKQNLCGYKWVRISWDKFALDLEWAECLWRFLERKVIFETQRHGGKALRRHMWGWRKIFSCFFFHHFLI